MHLWLRRGCRQPLSYETILASSKTTPPPYISLLNDLWYILVTKRADAIKIDKNIFKAVGTSLFLSLAEDVYLDVLTAPTI